jgi:hypothetical protein
MSAIARNALYRPLIEAAILEHTAMPTRSDQHGRYSSHYVDIGLLGQLHSGDWQVLFGRRGTGKTQLLGTLFERLSSPSEADDIAIFFTGFQFRASPVGGDVPDQLRGLGYFQCFIDDLSVELSKRVDLLLQSSSVGSKLSGSASRRREKAEKLGIEILMLAQTGTPLSAYGLTKQGYGESSDRTTGSKYSAHAGLDLSLLAAKPAVKAGAERVTSRSSRTTTDLVFDSPAVPRFSKVRRKILELLDQLGANRLYILIDEWSAMDSSASSTIQPIFAELLKITFAGTPRITVKIATNRYQSRFSNQAGRGAHRGLELGADIFPAVNLDRAVLNDDDLLRFYEQLLFRRLSVAEPRLAVFDPNGDGTPDEQFLLSIFKDARAYRELVQGAEGIPRRFLRVFNALAERSNYRLRELWGASSVQEMIMATLDDDTDLAYHSEASQLILQLQDLVVATKSRIFFVDREDAPMLQNAIDELLEKRLVHEVPRNRVSANLRGHFDVYTVDYGLWLDWQRSMRAAGAATSVIEELPMPTARVDAEARSVTAAGISRDQMRCVNCDFLFPRSSRPYEIRGLCPNCYRDPTSIDLTE